MRLPIARFRVADRSMEPAIDEGSHVIVNRLAYRLWPPRAGDIVVLRHPTEEMNLVKRVERVEGDKVYVIGDRGESSVDSRSFGPVTRELILGKVILRYG